MKKLMLIFVTIIILGSCGNKKSGEQKSVIIQPDKTEIDKPEKNQTNNMARPPAIREGPRKRPAADACRHRADD